jgi:16S rRNA (cytosine967-C5)-methyltransferase
MKQHPDHKGPGSMALLRDALELYYTKGYNADRSLNEIFRQHRLRDERMRADLANRLYGIIRFRRPIVTAIGDERISSIDDIKLLVDTLNKWKKIYKGEQPSGKEDGVMQKLKKYSRLRIMRESMPDILDKEGVKQLGEEKWTEVAAQLNRDPHLFIRVNTIKAQKQQVKQLLEEGGIKFSDVDGGEEALMAEKFGNVFASDAFHKGYFEVQDISSQRVAHFLDVKPGMRVLDACAGNGGKTLHLAALMKNKGKIIAMDVSQRKLDELRSRCTRNGIDIVETMLVKPGIDLSALKNSFDRVLIDAPCSGTGVIRRNPDIKWRLDEQYLDELQTQQQQILETYSALTNSKGKVVYASCSILPSEGEMQAKKFADREKWSIEEELRLDPSFGDGFFMARMKKIGSPENDRP